MNDIRSELASPPQISGTGNRVLIGERCHIRTLINVKGNDNTLDIGERVVINGGAIGFSASVSGSTICIGSRTTIIKATITAHESANITIGEDCQFSDGIFLDVSDMHPIYDMATGKRIDPASDIVIGNHVWLGLGAIVMKGVTIGAGSVIGAGSIVTRDIPANACAAGSPARVVREGIRWERKF